MANGCSCRVLGVKGRLLQSHDPFSEFRPLVSEDGLLALNVEKVT